jgi:broad specificity phosphatase PhoE
MDRTINLFRHGQAKYQQLDVPYEEANDLTDEGIAIVAVNAKNLAELVKNEQIRLVSSPMGRAKHTARIIANEISKYGKNPNCEIIDDLIEVRNFEWRLFCPLMIGGNVEYEGEKFDVDKSLTNPTGLEYPGFYIHFNGLTNEAKNKLPKPYVERVESFERYDSIVKRTRDVLSKLSSEGPERTIVATHDALLMPLMGIFYNRTKYSMDPGNYLTLKRNESGLYIVEAAGSKEGNSRADVLSLMHQYLNHI